LNEFDEAKEAYAKAIALNPADPELLYAAAVANWSNANGGITAEKAKLDAETEYSLIVSEGCPDVRTRFLPDIDSAIAMLNKAISVRKDFVDAMAYMNMLYRLRAEVECGSKKNFKADVKQSDEWAARAAEARKKKAEAAEKEDQEKASDKH
jgi:tetratricopeptide (TPR) repeat protein